MTKRTHHLLLSAAMALVSLNGCGGAEERKAEYLSRGKKYFEEHNYDKAKVDLKNALQIDPKMAKPYYYLGQIEESKQNWREAFGLYAKASELDPNDVDIMTAMAKFALLTKDFDKTSQLVGEILKERPGDVEGRLLKAAVASGQGRRNEAIAELEDLTSGGATRPDAYLVLAMLYGQKNDAAAAESILQKGIVANPANPALMMALAQLDLQTNKPDQAEEVLQHLIAADPGNIDHRTALVKLYVQLQRFDDAEKALRESIQADPKDVQRYNLLAEFFLRSRKPRAAIEVLEEAVKAYPDERPLQFALGQLYDKLNEADKAEALYQSIVDDSDDKPDILKAKDRLATIAAAQGKTEKATKIIDEVLEDSPQDFQALFLRGRIALTKKDAQTAITAFRSILKDHPDSVEVLTLLSSALQLDGKTALAQESLERAAAVKPEDFAPVKRLIEFLAKQKNFSAGLEKVNDYLKLNPKSLEAANVKADLLAFDNKPEELEKVLRQIKADFPDKPVGPFRLGQLFQMQKKYDAAIAEYEASLAKTDNDYEGLKAITAIYLEKKQPERALARLKKVITQKPDHPTAYQLLGVYYLSQKKEDDALKMLRKAIAVNPGWPVPYANLASFYVMKGQFDQAVKLYEDALARFPDNPDILINLAAIQEKAKDYPDAIKRYESLLAKAPNNLMIINNLAALLSVDGSNTENLKRAEELGNRLENSPQPAFQDTLAWIRYQTKDYAAAEALMLRALEKAPEVPIFHYHLGMILLKKGDIAGARDHLKKAVDANQAFDGLGVAKAELAKQN